MTQQWRGHTINGHYHGFIMSWFLVQNNSLRFYSSLPSLPAQVGFFIHTGDTVSRVKQKASQNCQSFLSYRSDPYPHYRINKQAEKSAKEVFRFTEGNA